MSGFADLWPVPPAQGHPQIDADLYQKRERDVVYRERAFVVAALARTLDDYTTDVGASGVVAWLARHRPKPGEAWEPEWEWVVYLDLNEGQVSWHIHRDELPLFDRLPRYEPHPDADNAGLLLIPNGETIVVDRRFDYDGHSTDEKYRRLYEYVTGRST